MTRATALPAPATRFIGRVAERAAVTELLGTERLVTLTGVGGGGKTRLAARVVADLTGHWPDGACWVELASVTDSAHVAALVAAALGVAVEPVLGPARSLTAALGRERLLVCLDNCEQVLDGAAEVAAALLACPDVTVLVTSREPLAVPGEVVWPVPVLDPTDAEALFADRSRGLRPGVADTDTDTDTAVRSLCARLDGIPLAIELAAAWLRTLTPAQIEEGLVDRFALLVRGPRGVAARQQTLAASIDWSHDLLGPAEQEMFRALAVCRGGFTLAMARAVGAKADVLGPVSRLVDTSLVVAEVGGLQVRYRMLETVREYAAARLAATGDTAAVRDRHLAHLLAVATAAEPEFDRDRDAWLALLTPERDNVAAALEWGLTAADPGPGRELAAAVAWLWNTRGRSRDGVEFLQQALRRAPQDRTALQARLLAGLAGIADTATPLDLDPAMAGYEIATEIGDDRLRGRLLALTGVALFFVDAAAGWARSEEALRIAESAGDPVGRDGALALRGLILHLRDRHDEARPVLATAAASLVRRGDRGIGATVVALQSGAAMLTGDLGTARQLAERAAQIAAPLADFHRVGTTTANVARLQGMAGDVEGGLRRMQPILAVMDATGVEVPGTAFVLGELWLRRGDVERAVGRLERAAPASGPMADTYPTALALPVLGTALRLAGRADAAAAVLERAVALAALLDMPGVGAAAREQQGHLHAAADPDRAAGLHHEALAIRVEHGLRTSFPDGLDALAGLAALGDRAAEATRIVAASDRARAELGYPRPPVDVPAHAALVERLRAALEPDVFDLAWTEGTALSLDDAVAFVRRTRGRRGRASSGWASLTPTEREVVRLAVEGLTNPEIGTKLLMGRGTVKTHLSHVFAKLGVANRTELATLAAAHDRRGPG
ncbi:LuxR C-terminal-related transcriptional regulator [Pseudonocardia sp. GCM10023141]|uniref:LuxR C-terminal-related transcriptional regulator n=1 Tax=Pseudonocardia sp. GCM10023141 TaxID=3252653 RepID=UPI003605D0F3